MQGFSAFSSVRPLGLEPRTTRLKVPSSPIATPSPDSTLRHQDETVALPVALTEQGSERGINDPDLARVVAAWPALPESIRRAMLALIGMNV
jgi:hypothetical protein